MINYKNKNVLLGITGSIAAYKMADVASDLTKRGINTETILTENGSKIISPIVFSTLTGNRAITKTFDENVNYNVAHVSLAKKTDVLLVAPATANIIAKLANGIADDMLTTTALACDCPKLIAPAMNTHMLDNPVVQDNIAKLRHYGWIIIEPDSGILACKDDGKGKLPKPEILVNYILKELSPKDLLGKRILITAGPTQEAIDPVRYITNNSSGKMGFALAEAAVSRGAEVTLVSGPTNLQAYPGVKVIPVKSAEEMYQAVVGAAPKQDYIIKAAAVADFTPATKSSHKLKKENGIGSIELTKTKDIIKTLGENKKENQFICGFSMETDDLIENSKSKLEKKNLDMICANSISDPGAGFKGDTNIITMITKDEITPLEKMSKLEVANIILEKIKSLENN